MSERINLVVEDGVADLLTALAGSERRRGAWVSEIARAMTDNAQRAKASSLDELRLAFVGLVGELKLLESRVLAIEGERREP